MKRELLDQLIIQYNHLIDYTIFIEEPSFLDVFKAALSEYDETIKPNRFVGAVFIILCELHDLKDDTYIDDGLRKIRTVSYKKELYNIVESIIQPVLSNLVHDVEDQESFLLEEVWQIFTEHEISTLDPIPDKNAFSQFYLLQDEKPIDHDFIDLIEDMIFDLYDAKVDGYEKITYNLLKICPFAHSGMSLFLNVVRIQDYKQLLNVIIRAFEKVHEDDLINPPHRFYYHENYRDYILALESLALLHKWEGNYEEAKFLYQKALQYDDLDVLKIRESVLLPLLATGDFEEFLSISEQLDDGIFKAYVELFNGLINAYEPLEYTIYETAYNASPVIMEMLCTKQDLYEDASEIERKYLDDFYGVWKMQEDILEYLKELYFKRTIS
ncbi:MAG: hypothetical protein UMR38_07600 [Candidatus Izemoplasma sp.]|nr:hypothetical protein [Candidatus Izemoplasma sp.]